MRGENGSRGPVGSRKPSPFYSPDRRECEAHGAKESCPEAPAGPEADLELDARRPLSGRSLSICCWSQNEGLGSGWEQPHVSRAQRGPEGYMASSPGGPLGEVQWGQLQHFTQVRLYFLSFLRFSFPRFQLPAANQVLKILEIMENSRNACVLNCVPF